MGILCMSVCGLNLVSIELEAPFGIDANDIDMEERHEAFVSMLEDVIKHPSSPPVCHNHHVEKEIMEGHNYVYGSSEGSQYGYVQTASMNSRMTSTQSRKGSKSNHGSYIHSSFTRKIS